MEPNIHNLFIRIFFIILEKANVEIQSYYPNPNDWESFSENFSVRIGRLI